ncbi:hypothetical protein F2P79_023241 [Pimephales promelas]|nr:hypothetical protein F2P79_023241 [Pimephales promelas]
MQQDLCDGQGSRGESRMRPGVGGPRVLLSGNKQGFYHISSSDSETAFPASLSPSLSPGRTSGHVSPQQFKRRSSPSGPSLMFEHYLTTSSDE